MQMVCALCAFFAAGVFLCFLAATLGIIRRLACYSDHEKPKTNRGASGRSLLTFRNRYFAGLKRSPGATPATNSFLSPDIEELFNIVRARATGRHSLA